jgi:Leucine-rich repeat (LRR) protein
VGRRKPRDIRPPRIDLWGRDAHRRVIDEDFDGVDLAAVTSCALREQPITRVPAFGPALVELELTLCKELVSLEGIERCTGLTKLRLDYLSDRLDLQREFARLAELPELTCLEVSGSALPDNVADLPSVIELDLMNCPLDLVTIGQVSTLRRLVLRGTSPWTLGDLDPIAGNVKTLELHDVGVMPPSIGVLDKLERLKIVRSRHLRKIPRDLGGLASLVELTIDAPIRTIDASICRCSKLEVLELGSSSVADLPEAIGDLARLHTLRLSSKTETLPESIGKLAALRVLWLPARIEAPASISQLCIEDYLGPADVGARIPRRTPSTPHKDDLRFGMNDPLPDDFGDPIQLELKRKDDHGPVPQLANLRRLERAELRVPDLESALAALANSPRLNHLSLYDAAVMPEALGRLDMLRALYASGTFATLPESIGNLAALERLFVTAPITTLPASFAKLARLDTLSLQCPQLGDVPACVAELPSLSRVYIDGELPAALARSRSITYVAITCSEPPKNLAALAGLAQLDSLVLSGPIAGLESLLAALAATSLRCLELGRGVGRALPSTISAVASTLVHLDLRRSDITKLPSTLRDCAALASVSLPVPEFGVDAVSLLPPIKWTKRKWSDYVLFERSKRQ